MNSIYIHIPFCDNLCNYCDFTKVLNYKNFVRNYLDMLESEIVQIYQNESIKTLYIGGGTPSAMSITELDKLFEIIDCFNLSSDCEITFEMNIESTTEEKLNLLYKNGVNRVSFGVQTFNNKLLKELNRFHSGESAVAIIECAKKIGFKNINIDLMFNLPNQTIENLENDLKVFKSLEISHLSIYSLILEEKSVFGFRNIEVNYDNFDIWYYKIKDFLEASNYIHYETSNFAKLGFESKHNLVYWNCQNYYGFGLGASSYISNKRCDNTTSITKYLNGEFVANCQILSELELMQEYMFLGLRKIEGVTFTEFYNIFGKNIFDVFNIDEIDRELFEISAETIKFSRKGLIYANEVLINFI
ncbi:MAG: radical SAM family heme chaperone HemW [Bacilli bacterium]